MSESIHAPNSQSIETASCHRYTLGKSLPAEREWHCLQNQGTGQPGRDHCGHLLPPPCPGRSSQSTGLHPDNSWISPVEETPTTSLGSLFQCPATHTEKFFLTFRWNSLCIIFCSLPLVPFLGSTKKSRARAQHISMRWWHLGSMWEMLSSWDISLRSATLRGEQQWEQTAHLEPLWGLWAQCMSRSGATMQLRTSSHGKASPGQQAMAGVKEATTKHPSWSVPFLQDAGNW